MREPTCMMQPITYTSICSAREPDKENPIQALSHSVSFGRFVSESLSWERWSVFSSKRYVEEAERFSQPGSVAEKKAFFETHYQRMAGKKHKADPINQLDVVEEKPGNDEKQVKETAADKDSESKSDVSRETKMNECEGESCPLDLTKSGSKEEKQHGEMNLVSYSGGSESSQEALMAKIKAESSETEKPQKRKPTTITWLMPLCISPAVISSKYRSSIAKSDKNTPKTPVAAVPETKNDSKRFFLAAQFSKFWSKCRNKLLCSIPSRLESKGKAARKNKEKIEKKPIEKKPRKWFQCLCFNSGSASTNHKEKTRTEDQKKRMTITCPKLCIKK